MIITRKQLDKKIFDTKNEAYNEFMREEHQREINRRLEQIEHKHWQLLERIEKLENKKSASLKVIK